MAEVSLIFSWSTHPPVKVYVPIENTSYRSNSTLTGRQPHRKTTSQEDNLTGRQSYWMTTSHEDDLTGRKNHRKKTTSQKDDLTGRRPHPPTQMWKSIFLQKTLTDLIATSQEDNLTGRQSYRKTILHDTDLTGRNPNRKAKPLEEEEHRIEDLTGR